MTDENGYLDLTSDIVSAFVSNNTVRANELPELIAAVHASLAGINAPKAVEPTVELKPAVPVKKSITDDFLVCLDDGKKFKSLRRHLATLSMTPDEYRTKWGLPRDYPMVAPGYAAKRSELAKATGLGSTRRSMPAAVAEAEPANDQPAEQLVTKAAAKRAKNADPVAAEPAAEAPPKRRGRPSKKAA